MGVPGITNSYDVLASVSENLSYERKSVRLSDNHTTVSKLGSTCVTGYGIRRHYSTNPIRVIKGVPWRDPSNYVREAVALTHHGGTRTGVTAGSRVTYDGYYKSVNMSVAGFLWSYPFYGGVTNGMSWLDSERNQARVECMLKLKEGKVNLGVFLGEARETASLLASTSAELFTALLKLKRGQPAGLKFGTGKDLAGGYLQFNLGWKPLMSDIKGIYDTFAGQIVERPMILEAVRQVRSNWSSKTNTTGWKDRIQTVRATNHCHVFAKVKDEFLASMNAYGLVNPLSLTWELIPLSFVIDWAMPIGNTLEAMTASSGLDFVSGSEFQKLESECNASVDLYPTYTGMDQRVEAERFSFERKKLSGFPSGGVYFKNPFSSSHATTALMLWRQLQR